MGIPKKEFVKKKVNKSRGQFQGQHNRRSDRKAKRGADGLKSLSVRGKRRIHTRASCNVKLVCEIVELFGT